jgi:CRISPR-associated protein Csy3
VTTHNCQLVLNESDDFNEIFNCNDYSNFDNTDKNVEQLTQKIAQTLSGESDFLLLEIIAFAKIGKSQDVYPSEELVLDKNNSDKKGKKSKILFSVGEVAAKKSLSPDKVWAIFCVNCSTFLSVLSKFE